MKITHIRVGRFGAWQNLDLPLSENGLHVFYGPNEAGKTTLLRFIRGVLYGFPPLAAASDRHRSPLCPPHFATGPARHGEPDEGMLRVEHDGNTWEIARTRQPDGRCPLSITGPDGEEPPEEILETLLAGTGQRIFDHVFAIGLHELQELATLQEDDVAQHIFEMTLGPQVQRLLEVSAEIERRQHDLLDVRSGTGELAELLKRDQAIARELESLQGLRERHAELQRERARLRQGIAALQGRKADLKQQVRGAEFLERVHPVWQQAREIRDELETLPATDGIPEGGLERLDELQEELASLRQSRDDTRQEADRLHRQADELPVDPHVEQHAATMQSFIDQGEWLMELEQTIEDAEARADRLKAEVDRKLENLGDEWSPERLDKVDTSPETMGRLLSLARNYQTALVRRSQLRQRNERLSKRCHQRMSEIAEQTRDLSGSSVEEAIESTRQELAELEDVGRLRLRESELERRHAGIHDQLDRLQTRLTLPLPVYIVLGFFGVTGIVLAILGFLTGLMTGGIAGTIYALLGTACCGMSWYLKTHFEGQTRSRLEQLEDEARENEVRLRETREAIAQMTGTDGTADEGNTASDTDADVDAIRRTARRLADLEQCRAREEWVHSARRRLSERRNRFQEIQREVAAARKNWCDALTQLGLTESVYVDQALEEWQQAADAREQQRQWQAALETVAQHRQTWQSFRQRVEELGHRIHRWDADYSQPLDVLYSWEEELKALGRHQAERRRLHAEEEDRRREADRLQKRVDEVELQESALLIRAGAATRDEFRKRAEAAERRSELEELLATAEEELERLSQSEPELAIVEEDLEQFSVEENERRKAEFAAQLEKLEGDVAMAHEELGRTGQEIARLEEDRRPTELRFERAQLTEKLQQTANEWFALQLADRAVARIRHRLERDCQPQILEAASPFLQRLSCGKFQKIWTPLDERRLLIDDEHGRTHTVEQLSGGTREQLFLAIRLALVRDFSRNGAALPVVFDDVLVNFDEERTEAAVDTLREFADEGQQMLLFTCHLSLARQFEERGVAPIHLPGHNRALEERRAG